MFYEETIIDGVLHCRRRPGDRWEAVGSPKGKIVNTLWGMTDDERLEVFRWFCKSCGAKQPSGRTCSCMREE